MENRDLTFILASNSAGKKHELLSIFRPLIPGISIISARDAGFEPIDPDETGETFEENARIKARAFVALTGLPSIADDSGLCVDALGGAPGVRTARYGGDHDPDAGIALMLRKLDGVPKSGRTARFVCAICCVWPDGRELTSSGSCEGFIGLERGGDAGFGFDPIFYLPDGRCFGNISEEDKNAVSHRGNAVRGFAEKLMDFIQKDDL